jgi:hypothetical protein
MNEGQTTINLGALADGNLHLVAFLGDKFAYLVKDPRGSGWLIEEALSEQFPAMVRRLLADNE